MQQIAVGRMDLDDLKAGRQCPPSRGFERVDDSMDTGFVESQRGWIGVMKRNGAGADDVPAALPRLQRRAAKPGKIMTGFATRVRELNANGGTLRTDESSDTSQRFGVCIGPDSHVAGRNATVPRDGSRLDHDQRHSARRSTSQVYQVPIIRHALLGTVLTHGRHDDSIAELESTNGQRTQQINFRHASIVFSVRRTAM